MWTCNIRLCRRHRVPITQVLVLLRPPPDGTSIDTEFRVENTHHRYQVTCLWEQGPERFLEDQALLPLAALAAGSPDQLLSQIAQRISQIESVEERQEVITCTRILAGLSYSRALIDQFLREGMMRESVIYQDILSGAEKSQKLDARGVS